MRPRYSSLVVPALLGDEPESGWGTDLPRLLRRLAGCTEERGIDAAYILDVTIESEITEDGPWWSASVYWSPSPPPAGP